MLGNYLLIFSNVPRADVELAVRERITIPVLVIHGTSDHTVPIDASGRRSAKLLPNAMLTEYEGEPHGLFLTAADRLNEELLQFVGGRAF